MLESHQQNKFNAEIAIHLPERSGLDKPIVWVFPELLVCLNCGKAEFAIPEDQLRLLIKGSWVRQDCGTQMHSGGSDRA